MNGTGAGAVSGPLKGFSDDWSNLKLNQVGSRRNVGGLYRIGRRHAGRRSAVARSRQGRPGSHRTWARWTSNSARWISTAGKVDLDFGKVDLDFGKVDLSLGKVDLDAGGKVDLGKVDLDLGAAESGSGDIGRGDFGGGDLNVNDPANPLGEIDATLAADLARTPPNSLRVCVVGAGCDGDRAPACTTSRRASSRPHIGGVTSFTLYRVEGPTLRPGLPWTLAATVLADPSKPDGEDIHRHRSAPNLVDGQQYTYFAVTNYAADGVQDAHRQRAVQPGDDHGDQRPVAADVYATNEDTPLTVPRPGSRQRRRRGQPVRCRLAAAGPPRHGRAADGSFTYSPARTSRHDGSRTVRRWQQRHRDGDHHVRRPTPAVTALPTRSIRTPRRGRPSRGDEGAALVLTGSSATRRWSRLASSSAAAARPTVTVTPAPASRIATITSGPPTLADSRRGTFASPSPPAARISS